MALMKFEVVAGANTYTKQVTISNTDAQRILSAYQAIYATQPTAEDPNPPALTPQQVVDAIGLGTFKGIKANVERYENELAKAAVPAPTEIVLS